MSKMLSKALSPFRYFSGDYVRQWKSAAAQTGFTAVVCYHSITENQNRRNAYAVEAGLPLDVFVKQMAFLKRHFQPVLPSSAAENIPGELRCVVTFDDGYLDNFTLAAPVLEHFGIKAGFYVCSDYVGSERWFWWETLGDLLRRSEHTALNLAAVFPDAVGNNELNAGYSLENHSGREQAYSALAAWMSPKAETEIQPVLSKLAAELGVEPSSAPRKVPLMNWLQIRELRQRGFEIGAHTANHVNLGQATPEVLQREVIDSHHILESSSDGPVTSFAYPYGRQEHLSAAALATIKQLGYRTAFTTIRGIAGKNSLDLLTPRFHLNPKWGFGCAYNTDQALLGGNRPVDFLGQHHQMDILPI